LLAEGAIVGADPLTAIAPGSMAGYVGVPYGVELPD